MSKTVQKFLIHNPDKPNVKSVSINFSYFIENSNMKIQEPVLIQGLMKNQNRNPVSVEML